MIVTEIISIDDNEYTRTYSDSGMMIERDGARYSEAVDPVDSGRVYNETEVPANEDVKGEIGNSDSEGQ